MASQTGAVIPQGMLLPSVFSDHLCSNYLVQIFSARFLSPLISSFHGSILPLPQILCSSMPFLWHLHQVHTLCCCLRLFTWQNQLDSGLEKKTRSQTYFSPMFLTLPVCLKCFRQLTAQRSKQTSTILSLMSKKLLFQKIFHIHRTAENP